MMSDFIYNYILSDVGRCIWDSFENHPEEWEQEEYTVINHDKEITLWTSNGTWFFTGYRYHRQFTAEGLKGRKYPPKIIWLGYIERHFLYRKYKKMTKSKIAAENEKLLARFIDEI